MFTGIIESIGIIRRKTIQPAFILYACESRIITNQSRVGDSISVNGVCQTITEIRDSLFFFQTIQDTLHQTTMGQLLPGNRVNLEPAATPTTRLGGHWVNGHIDLKLPILEIEIHQPAYLVLDIPESHIAYCVPKGSITLDGIGLTIQEVTQHRIRVGLIAHTLSSTTLNERKNGDLLNIEFDILAKYVFEYLKKTGPVSQTGAGITEKLRQAGFM